MISCIVLFLLLFFFNTLQYNKQYIQYNQAPLAELITEDDETLFKNILHTKQHVLHQLLPDRTQSTYNLRSRKHDCSLIVKHSVTANEFITRMLYKDMY